MAALMGIREYARYRRVSPAAVRKAISSGRIPAVNGKIDPEVADAQWAANTDPGRARNGGNGVQAPGPRAAEPHVAPTSGHTGAHSPDSGPVAPVSPSSGPLSATGGLPRTGPYTAARAVRETYEARLKELDFNVRSGDLVSADEVRVASFTVARKARDLLLALPDRLSAVLAGLTETADVHRVLSEEVRRVCEELSQPPALGEDDRSGLD